MFWSSGKYFYNTFLCMPNNPVLEKSSGIKWFKSGEERMLMTASFGGEKLYILYYRTG